MSGISRRKCAAAKLGVGLTKFGEDFVDRGDGEERPVPGTDGKVKRLRPVPLGERAIGFLDEEIDKLIEGLRALRDATPRAPRQPAVPADFHPSRHRKGKQSGRLLSPAAR